MNTKAVLTFFHEHWYYPIKIFGAFLGPEYSSPVSQKIIRNPCSKPDECIFHSLIILPKDRFVIFLPRRCWVPKCCSCLVLRGFLARIIFAVFIPGAFYTRYPDDPSPCNRTCNDTRVVEITKLVILSFS